MTPEEIKKRMNDAVAEALKNYSPPKPASKPVKQIITSQQSERLNHRLETLLPQFKKAIGAREFDKAKVVIADLQDVLRGLNKTAKLVEVKNQFFELALDQHQYDFAIEGFLSNRSLVTSKTRLHLEATALLAIAYLRKQDIERAKPFIKDVLQNRNIIKSAATRAKFNKEIIARFDEEIALFSLKTDCKFDIDENELHNLSIAVQDLSEDQLYEEIGKSLPRSTKELMYEVDKFAKNQLTYTELKALPSSEELVKNDLAGKTVFSAIKLVIYKSLCDPNSEVYKIWYTNTVGVIIDKKFITSAVIFALTGFGIGAKALLIPAAALVIRFGLDVYCEKYKPAGITEFRRKSD